MAISVLIVRDKNLIEIILIQRNKVQKENCTLLKS